MARTGITKNSPLILSESSTVAVRSVSAVLKGEDFDPFLVSPLERMGASVCNLFPHGVRKSIMGKLSGMLGADFNSAKNLNADDFTKWVVSQYPGVKSDAIIVGAPSGGVAHLASLVGAPFLTQHFLLGFRGYFPIDDSRSYLDECRNAAETIVKNNPDLQAIIHYDPLHDRFLVKREGLIRVKLLSFSGIYREFVKSSLKEGGTIILVGCCYPWMQYQISEKIRFQLGGLGGVPPDEYYSGSDRIDKYINRERKFDGEKSEKTHSGWLLDGFPLENAPESEWGLIRSFADDVKSFATENGYRVFEADFDHPDELSAMMFDAFGRLILREYPSASRRIFMDSFTNSSPSFNRKVCARPLWLPFICDDSYEYAIKLLSGEPPDTEILLALHPSFSDPLDLTPLDKWITSLSRFKKVTLVGINPSKYPSDMTAYFKFGDDLVRYSRNHPKPLKSIMSIDEFNLLFKQSRRNH